jgi:hypothetical protein
MPIVYRVIQKLNWHYANITRFIDQKNNGVVSECYGRWLRTRFRKDWAKGFMFGGFAASVPTPRR